MNWFAVIAAALSSFVLGGLWYGPLFGNAWMKAAGVSPDQVKNANKVLIFGGTFVLALISAMAFSFMLGNQENAASGALYGALGGFCFVAASFASTYLFEHKPLSLWLINGGYRTLQFTLIGLILGAWR